MDCWDVSGYPIPRFASEYGFQSYPSFETLAQVSTPKDWNYSSDFMDHRQHHGNGGEMRRVQESPLLGWGAGCCKDCQLVTT